MTESYYVSRFDSTAPKQTALGHRVQLTTWRSQMTKMRKATEVQESVIQQKTEGHVYIAHNGKAKGTEAWATHVCLMCSCVSYVGKA